MSEEKRSLPASEHAPRWRMLLRNPVSLAGIAVSLVALANIFLFVLIGAIGANPSPYIGIVAYVVAPAFLVLGLLLMAAGILLERRRKLPPADFYPKIDLSDRAQRGAVISFFTFLLLFIFVSAIGSYKAYEFTESVQFCGATCHTPMHPEFTAYQVSPHARVPCVSCHVGLGATWYVKSKVSGVRQLFTAALNTFPRPIPTPVANLRPAQDTCEQCHWPKKFQGRQLKTFTHYASDESNTLRQVQLLVNVGGGDPAIGATEGIHWHMNIANRIDYVAADTQRQVIDYIRLEDAQGRVTEYYATNPKLTKDQIAKANKHRMDCVDCHNRPTHIYVPPDRAVDDSLQARRLDASLPFIKQQSVALLSDSYGTTDAAMQAIASKLRKFYEEKYPQIAKSKPAEIQNASTEIEQIFRRTMFPEMKTNWQTHPNNVGHFYSMGCFRCHDGAHVAADGKVVSKDCNQCHTVVSQKEGVARAAATAAPNFQHPLDLGDMEQVNCSDCHTGGSGP